MGVPTIPALKDWTGCCWAGKNAIDHQWEQVVIQAVLEAFLYPVFELFIRLPGYLFLRFVFGPSAYDLENTRVLLAGFLIWLAIGSAFAVALWLW